MPVVEIPEYKHLMAIYYDPPETIEPPERYEAVVITGHERGSDGGAACN